MKTRYTTAVFAIFALMFMLLPDAAGAITERQKRDCKADYNRFCKKYAVGSEGLRACMSRSIKNVSNRCISALVAGGDMTRAQADKLRKRKSTRR